MVRLGTEIDLPFKGDLGYLIDYLAELGEAVPKGEVLMPNSWQDIKAWVDLVGLHFTPKEVTILRHLSIVYANQYNDSNGKDCIAPVINVPEPEKVIKKIESFFAAMRSLKHER